MISTFCHEDLLQIYSSLDSFQAVDMTLPYVSEVVSQAIYVLRYSRIKLLNAGCLHNAIPVLNFAEFLNRVGVPAGVAALLDTAIRPALQDRHAIDALFLEDLELQLIGEELLEKI